MGEIKKRVLVGMTGGVDSTTTAYLLKQQKFECIGLSIQFLDKPKIIARMQETIAKAKQIPVANAISIYSEQQSKHNYVLEEEIQFLQSNCGVDDLDRVKKICDNLEIPLYAVNACEEYEYAIIEPLLSAMVSGRHFESCVWCHRLIFDILRAKADLLKADFISTGHYAKVQHDPIEKSYHVRISNDRASDQSYLLSTLQQSDLERLLLPLAGLRSVDAQRLIGNFKFRLKERRCHNCFEQNIRLFIETYVAPALRPQGQLVLKSDGSGLGDHGGTHLFRIGQKDLPIREEYYKQKLVKESAVVQILPNGQVTVGLEDELCFAHAGLEKVTFREKLDISTPLTVFIKWSISSPFLMASLFIKNNNTAVITFSEKIHCLIPGQHICFYQGREQNAYIIGHGTVSYLGPIDLLDRVDIPRKKEDEDQISFEKRLADEERLRMESF